MPWTTGALHSMKNPICRQRWPPKFNNDNKIDTIKSNVKRLSSMKNFFRRCICRPHPERTETGRWKSTGRLHGRYFCRTFIEIWHSLWLNLYDEIQVKSKDLLIEEIYYTPTNSKLVVLQELTLSILKIILKYQGAKLFLADFILPNIDWDK